MNRYELYGIAADVLLGRHVVFVGQRAISRQAFVDVVEQADGWEQVRRSNGNELATHKSGGSLALLSVSGLRGRLVDVIVVPDYRGLPEIQRYQLLEHMAAIRATRPNLELLRY